MIYYNCPKDKEKDKMKTIENLNKELQQIRRARKAGKYESGMFGFKACKESIKWERNNLNGIMMHYGLKPKRVEEP